MDKYIKVNGKMINKMVMVKNILNLKILLLKVNLKTVWKMEREKFNLMIIVFLKVSLKMIL